MSRTRDSDKYRTQFVFREGGISLGSVIWKKSTDEASGRKGTGSHGIQGNVTIDDHGVCLVYAVRRVVGESVHIAVRDGFASLFSPIQLLGKHCQVGNDSDVSMELDRQRSAVERTCADTKERYSSWPSSFAGFTVMTPLTTAPGKYAFLDSLITTDIHCLSVVGARAMRLWMNAKPLGVWVWIPLDVFVHQDTRLEVGSVKSFVGVLRLYSAFPYRDESFRVQMVTSCDACRFKAEGGNVLYKESHASSLLRSCKFAFCSLTQNPHNFTPSALPGDFCSLCDSAKDCNSPWLTISL